MPLGFYNMLQHFPTWLSWWEYPVHRRFFSFLNSQEVCLCFFLNTFGFHFLISLSSIFLIPFIPSCHLVSILWKNDVLDRMFFAFRLVSHRFGPLLSWAVAHFNLDSKRFPSATWMLRILNLSFLVRFSPPTAHNSTQQHMLILCLTLVLTLWCLMYHAESAPTSTNIHWSWRSRTTRCSASWEREVPAPPAMEWLRKTWKYKIKQIPTKRSRNMLWRGAIANESLNAAVSTANCANCKSLSAGMQMMASHTWENSMKLFPWLQLVDMWPLCGQCHQLYLCDLRIVPKRPKQIPKKWLRFLDELTLKLVTHYIIGFSQLCGLETVCLKHWSKNRFGMWLWHISSLQDFALAAWDLFLSAVVFQV